MPQLVQDEAGNLFVDTGGGVYHPVSEDQAKAFQANPGMGENALAAAGQGIENLITGAGSLATGGDEYWRQANQAGRAQSDALALAQPVTAPAAQYAPQALLGAGAGSVPAAAITEGLLGAMTTPEAPVQGAAIGALLGGAGAALPGVAQYGYGKGKALAGDLPWFGQGSKLADDLPPGYVRPGDLAQGMDELAPNAQSTPGMPQPGADVAASPPAAASASPFTDLSADMSAGPLQARPGGAAATDAVGDLPLSSQRPRMADRVTERLGAADDGVRQELEPRRVMGGNLTPDYLDSIGVPTSKGQRDLLNATTPRAAAEARDLMAREEASMSNPVLGARQTRIRGAQQEAATNYLARELDMPPGVAITDPSLGEVFQAVGGRMDEIANEMGAVPMTPELKTEFAQVLEQATGNHKGQLKQLSDELVAMADLNSGQLTGQQWGEVRTKLNNMIEAGMRQGNIGKVSDAQELMDVMVRNLEDRLPDETKRELRRLRKQYAIAQTLAKPGARNADGQVNPVSFYNNWKRPQSKKLMGQDDVGSFMNTMVTLTKRRTPDSGTAGRLLQAGASMGLDLLPGGGFVKRGIGL